MIFDKCCCEPRDGGKFLTALDSSNMHWWMYLAYSAADDVASTLAAMAKVGSVVGSLKTVGGPAAWALTPQRSTIHKPVLLHLCPHTIVRLRYTMVQLIFVNVTVHPALHMVTTERREWDARPGMMWAARAPAGRSGRSKVQVCVDCTLSPFGRRAIRGTVAGTMLVAGASVVRKWLVAPESRIAHCLMVVASVDIVRRRTEAVSAYLWVGVG
jgi:hypothetical protein